VRSQLSKADASHRVDSQSGKATPIATTGAAKCPERLMTRRIVGECVESTRLCAAPNRRQPRRFAWSDIRASKARTARPVSRREAAPPVHQHSSASPFDRPNRQLQFSEHCVGGKPACDHHPATGAGAGGALLCKDQVTPLHARGGLSAHCNAILACQPTRKVAIRLLGTAIWSLGC
jgi:hypothetical protein